jgi:sulfate transport system permease protein
MSPAKDAKDGKDAKETKAAAPGPASKPARKEPAAPPPRATWTAPPAAPPPGASAPVVPPPAPPPRITSSTRAATGPPSGLAHMPESVGRGKPPPSHTWLNVRANLGRMAWTIVIWTLFAVFVLGPLVTVAAFSVTPSVFRGLGAFTFEWYKQLFTQSALFRPLITTFEVASIVVVVQLILGTLVAYATARRRIFGSQAMDAMSNLTIALPSVVVGLALLSFYGPVGPIHALSDLIFQKEFSLTLTLWIIVFAHVLETFPYMVRTVGAVLQQIPPNLEMAARSLGAGKFTVFRTIVLPLIRPGLLAGGVLVFSRSIAEFGATIIVVSAALKTAPISIYEHAESGAPEVAAAYSVVLMLVSFGVYLFMRRWVMKKGMMPVNA